MAFQEVDRVQIRKYLGYSGLWLQGDPRVESAITNIQATADGGTRPDNSSEVEVRTLLEKLQGVDDALEDLDDFKGTLEADSNKFNPVLEDRRLRARGRMFVFRLAKMLDTEPRADVFSSGTGVGPSQGFRADPAYAAIAGGGKTAY